MHNIIEIEPLPEFDLGGDGKRNYRKGAENSIANQPHKHSREIARRLRQQEQKA